MEDFKCQVYAYISDYPDNCGLSVLGTEKVNMVKQGTEKLYH